MKRLAIGFTCLATVLALGCDSGSRSTRSSSSTAGGATAGGGTVGGGTVGGGTSGTGGTGGTSGEFQRTYQGRNYFLYVPDSYVASQATPVAVFFHGAGDTAANFWNTMKASGWDQAARAEQMILVVPDTKSPQGDWPNWSGNPNNDTAQMQAEMDEVVDLLKADIGGSYNVQLSSLHAAGFSNGGLFAAVAGIPHADLATTTILGYGWGAFYPVTPAAKKPVQMACGTQDGQFFNFAQQSEAFLRQQGHTVRWEAVSGVGHSLSGISASLGPASLLGWMKTNTTGVAPGGSTGGGATGSGGTGGAVGMTSRSVNVPAGNGLPAFTYDFDVYVGQNYVPGTPAPLILAGNMGLTPWRALADAETLIVIDFRDHDRNGSFTFDYDVASINAALTDVEALWNVDTKRRYFHGFSAAAHWGYTVILASADNFAGLGINAGSMQFAIQTGVWPNSVPRKIAVAIRHGTADTVVPVAAGVDARNRLQGAQHPVQYTEFNGDHTIAAADAQDVWSYLKQFSLP